MQKVSINDLKYSAKNRLEGNWGNGILITIVPILISMVFTFFFSLMFNNIRIAELLIVAIITAIFSFMTLNMLLPFVKGSNHVDFSNSLSPRNRLGKFIGYILIISIIAFTAQIPANLIFFESIFNSAESIDLRLALFNNDVTSMLSFVLRYQLAILSISAVLSLLMIPLFFTRYIIVDEDLPLMDSVKKSIRLTKGNYIRIILLSLSFLGWNFLIGLTLGLAAFYVLPYQQVTFANFYLAVKEENGEPFTSIRESNQVEKADDWLEEKPVEESTTSEWDF